MLPRAKKSFGQNFLIDQGVVAKIIQAARVSAGETVLEIGPGTGVLTSALVAAGARVIAVEKDSDLIPNLKETLGDSVQVVEGDVLSLSVEMLVSASYKVVANIPYNITSPILEKFLSHPFPPKAMVLMVQKEVADRIVARPGEMSVLSVMCQLYATCSRVTNVKAGSFRPIPKVDSAVVLFDHIGENTQGTDPESVIALAKMGFSSRRKQLHHNILPWMRRFQPTATAEDARAVIRSIGLSDTVRAEELSIENWNQLRKVFPTAA